MSNLQQQLLADYRIVDSRHTDEFEIHFDGPLDLRLTNDFTEDDEVATNEELARYRRWLWDAIRGGNAIPALKDLIRDKNAERDGHPIVIGAFGGKQSHATIIVRAAAWYEAKQLESVTSCPECNGHLIPESGSSAKCFVCGHTENY